MLSVIDGSVHLCGSTLNWNTRKDVITQWQTRFKLLLDWTQTQWDQSLMELHWEQHISQSSQPCCSWEWSPLRTGDTCHCRPCTCTDAYYWLGWSLERGSNVEHSVGLAEAQKKTDLKSLLTEHTSSEEGRLILWNWQNFRIHQGYLYLCWTPKGETKDLVLFMVPRAHHVAALNGCHWDVGHQGPDHTLSLLQEHFLWLGMTT